MNINKLLIVSLLLLLFIDKNDNIENFDGNVTMATCIERILNYGCLDEEKKEKLNEDCERFQMYIPTGLVNVSCNDQLLFDTLMCNKMLSQGACECEYGRRQVHSMCNKDPLNIKCPSSLKGSDFAAVEKIKSLEKTTEKCVNIEQNEKKIVLLAEKIKLLINNSKLKNVDKNFIKKNRFIIGIVIIILVGTYFYFKNK